MRGRKPDQESRSTEFRWKLLAWKRSSESLRPSLRALACELSTSHQLLSHYLDGLEKWECNERYRRAKNESEKIRARANAEGRLMTGHEEHQVHAYDDSAINALLTSALLKTLEGLKRAAKHGPLNWHQIKMLKLLDRNGFPEARELLRKCLQDGVKERKRFVEIVRETPRQEREPYIAWVRRIWDQCDKYGANCPRLLRKSSQKSAREVELTSSRIICQRFPLLPLSPLDLYRGKWRKPGNSAKPEGREGRMPSYQSSMENLASARARWRPPRPWRSSQEAQLIQRFAFQWFTCCDPSRPSGRDWARQLGISHTWLQKLVRKFEIDPSGMYREQRRSGDPNFAQISRARELTQRMRERGEIRPSGREKIIEAYLKRGRI